MTKIPEDCKSSRKPDVPADINDDIPGFGLETLEQRILLSGDLPVFGTDGSSPTTADQVDVVQDITPEPDVDTPAVVADPDLTLTSSTGSRDLDPAQLDVAPLIVDQGQTLSGRGAMGQGLVNTGTVSPGNSPGVLQVTDYTQDASATLISEIGGTTPGSAGPTGLDGYDQLVVDGQASLAGTLDLDFINDFRPVAGQVYDVMRWTNRIGSFTNYSGLYAGNGVFMRPTYMPDRLRLEAVQIPGLAQLNLGDVPEAQAAVDEWMTALANKVTQTSILLSASLDIQGMRLAGDWAIAVAPTSFGVETTLTLTNGAATWLTGGLSGGLTDVSGTYAFGGSTKATIAMAGTGTVAGFGGSALAGDFSIAYDAAESAVTVTATSVSARLGDPSLGAAVLLQNGNLDLRMTAGNFELTTLGTGLIDGIAGSSFVGTLALEASTATNAARFVARGATVTLADVGALQGDFVFAAQQSVTDGVRLQELKIGADNVTGQLALGQTNVTAAGGRLGVVLQTRGPESGLGVLETTSAIVGKIDLSLDVDDALSLSGTGITLAYNASAFDVSHQIAMADGSVVFLDVDASTTTLSGVFAASIDGIFTFSGALELDISTTTRVLSDATQVKLTEYALTGLNIAASFGGANGLSASGSDFALVYAREVDGPRSWVTSQGSMEQAEVGGYLLDNLDVARWSVNRAVSGFTGVPDAPTLNWSDVRTFNLSSGVDFVFDQVGDIFSLPITGDVELGGSSLSGSMVLGYDRSQNAWNIALEDVSWVMAAGPVALRMARAAGSMRIDSDGKRSGNLSGVVELTGIDGVMLAADGQVAFDSNDTSVSVGATGVLGIDGFATVSGAFTISKATTVDGPTLIIGAADAEVTVGPDAGNQVVVSGANLGLVARTDALGETGFALIASGAVGLKGFDSAIDFTAVNAKVAVNRLGTTLSENIQVGTQTIAIDFDSARDSQSVSIEGAQLTLGGEVTLFGDVRIDSKEVALGGATRQQMEFGFENLGVSGVTLGGATATLSDGKGAVLLLRNADGTTGYAVQASGNAALYGLSGVSLDARNMAFSLNQTGAALDLEIATATGLITLAQTAGEKRLTGTASATVDGVVNLSGSLFLEAREAQDVQVKTTAVGDTKTFETVSVDMLLLGGANLSVGLHAGDASVTLGDVNLGLVLSSEADGTRRWITTTADVGTASVEAVAEANVTMAMLDINRALGTAGALLPSGTPIIDWSGDNAELLSISEGVAVPLSIGADCFATGITGSLSLGGALVEGVFQVREYRDGTSDTTGWEIVMADAFLSVMAGGAKASIAGATGSFIVTDSVVTGSVSGVGSVTGVDGLTASGSLSASFEDGVIALAGTLDLAVVGVGSLNGNFAIVHQSAVTGLAVETLNVAGAATGRASIETEKGGIKTNARLGFNLTNSGSTQAREGQYYFELDGVRQGVTTLAADGRPVEDATLRQRLQSALAAIPKIGLGNVTVSGTRADGFTFEFIGALAGKPMSLATASGGAGLWVEQPVETLASNDWAVVNKFTAASTGVNAQSLLTLQHAGVVGAADSFTLSLGDVTTQPISLVTDTTPINAIQTVTITSDADAIGLVWLSHDGQRTDKVRLSDDPATLAASIQSILEDRLGTGNVAVAFDDAFTSAGDVDYSITFQGALAGQNVAMLSVFSSNSAVELAVVKTQTGRAGFGLAEQADRIASALNESHGAGSVSVSHVAGTTLADASFRIDFKGALGLSEQSTIVGATGVADLTVDATQSVAGSGASGTVQFVYVPQGANTDRVTLRVNDGTTEYVTSAIALDAAASVVQTTILAAVDSEGTRFGATGAEVRVTLRGTGADVAWQIAYEGSLAGQNSETIQAQIFGAFTAPEAALSTQVIGSVRSETQTLDLSQSTNVRLSVEGREDQTPVLDAATVTADELKAALGALAGIRGAGNIEVTALAQAGQFQVTYMAGLGAQNVAPLLVSPVQTVALIAAGDARPTSVSLRIGDGDWSVEQDISGLENAALAGALADLIAAQPGMSRDAISVTLCDAETLAFDVTYIGALAGIDAENLTVLTATAREVEAGKLLIGATNVEGQMGDTSSASFALSNGALAVLVTTGADGTPGFALEASGDVSLTGFGSAVSFSATGALRVNGLGEAVAETITTGPTTDFDLAFASGLAQQTLEITTGSIMVDGLGELTGGMIIERTQSVLAGVTKTDIRIGVDQASGDLTLGPATATLSDGRGAILLRHEIDASGAIKIRHAVQAEGSVAVTGISGISLSASNLSIAYNRWGTTVDASVATPDADYVVSLLAGETRLRGEATATLDGILEISGDLFIENLSDQTVILSDGSSIVVDQLIVGGADINTNLLAGGTAANPLVALSDVDIAMVYSTEANATVTARNWITTQANMGGLSVKGYDISDLSTAVLTLNKSLDLSGGLAVTSPVVIDWAANSQTISLSDTQDLILDAEAEIVDIEIIGSMELGGAVLTGAFNVHLDQSGGADVWTVSATAADLGYRSGGAYVGLEAVTGSITFGDGIATKGSLSGNAVVEGVDGFAFNGNMSASLDASGAMSFNGTAALEVDGFGTLAGALSVTKSATGEILVGASNVTGNVGSASGGIALTGGTLGVYLQGRSATSAGFALVANGTANLTGFPDVSMSAAASVRINTLGRILNETVGGVALDFATGDRLEEVTISSGTLAITGVGSLTGALAFTNTTSTDAGIVTVDTRIGLQDVSGNLDLGALDAALTDGTGAILLKKVGTADGNFAVQVEGNVALTGAEGIALTASNMKVSYNNLGKAVIDLPVNTGNGSYLVSLLNGETRASGTATAVVGGLSLSGDIFVEARTNVSVPLINAGGGASSATVNQTIIGGSALSLAISQSGNSLANLDDANLALVVSTDTTDPTQRWVTAAGGIGALDVFGTQMADITTASFSLNQALSAGGDFADAATATVIDWSGATEETVALSPTNIALVAVFDDADRRLEIVVDGIVDFGPARVAGAFDLILTEDGAGASIWNMNANNVEVSLTAADAAVSLTGGTGTLILSATQKTGSLSGDVAVTGVPNLTLSGTIGASFDGTDLTLSGTGVDVGIDGFGALSGNFAIEKTGTGADATLLVGLDQVTADLGSVALRDGQLGLYIAQNDVGAMGFALEASGKGAFDGFNGLTMDADASVRVNRMQEVVTASIDVNGTPVDVIFDTAANAQELVIQSGTITVADLGTITGTFAMVPTTVTDVAGVTTQTLRVGLSGVTGNLTPGGVGADLTQGDGALILERVLDTAGTVVTSGYGLQMRGSVALSGIDGLDLQANQMDIRYNRMGRVIENERILTGGEDFVLSLADNETRLTGAMVAGVTDIVEISGQMALESRTGANAATVTLSDGTSVVVDQLIIGGAGVRAAVGTAGAGAQIGDLDVALIVSTEQVGAGQTARRWITTQSVIGEASINGYALANLNEASLQINSEIKAGAVVLGSTDPVIDWNGANNDEQTDIVVSSTRSLAVDLGERVLEIGVDGGLTLGDAEMRGIFVIALEESATGQRAWRINASDVAVSMKASGAEVGLSDGTGELWLGKNDITGVYGSDQVSGFVQGTASLTGVKDLTLSGTFRTEFDSTGNMVFAGAVDVDVAGYAKVSGEVAVEISSVQTAGPTKVVTTLGDSGTATIQEVVQGGVKESSRFALVVSEMTDAGRKTRVGDYSFSHNGATATVSIDAGDSAAVWRSKLTQGLQSLFGFGTIEVTGTIATDFEIALTGIRKGVAITDLVMVQPDDPADRDDWGSNFVSQEATATTGSVHRLDMLPESTEGMIAFTFDFDAASNASFKLTASDGAGTPFREGAYTFTYDGETATASTQSSRGVALTDSGVRGKLTTAFETLFGTGSVVVEGNRDDGFDIKLQSDMAGIPVGVDSGVGGRGLHMRPPVDPNANTPGNDQSVIIAQAIQSTASTAYDLQIAFPTDFNPSSDAFQLGFENSARTADVQLRVGVPTVQTQQIFDAIDKFFDVGTSQTTVYTSGSVLAQTASGSVRIQALQEGQNEQTFNITFLGDAADRALQLGALGASNIGVTPAITYDLTASGAAAATTGSTHTLSRFDSKAEGTFTLTFDYQGTTYTTGDIDMQGSAVVLRTALLAAKNTANIRFDEEGATVSVTKDSASQWRIAFAGNTLGKPISNLLRSNGVEAAPDAELTAITTGLTNASGTYSTNDITFADFNSDGTVLQSAIETALRADGAAFIDSNATVEVTFDSDARQWVVSFGGLAIGQDVGVMRSDLAPTRAPEATLQQTATGRTTDEQQRIDLTGAAGGIQFGFKGSYSDVLAADALDADALSSALVGLGQLTATDFTVTQTSEGVFDVTFGDTFAGRNVPMIDWVGVATLDLTLSTDDALADVVYLRAAGETDWARTVEIPEGATDGVRIAAVLPALTRAYGLMPGVGHDAIELVAVDGQSTQFYLKTKGTLAGSVLPDIDVTLARAVQAPENLLKLGAADVNVFVGTDDAGIAVENAGFGLVITRDATADVAGVAAAPAGFALIAEGTARLYGFGSDVSISATAEVSINALGRALDETVRTGVTTADRQVTFTNDLARRELAISNGDITVAGLGTIMGDLKVISTTEVDGATTIQNLEIGVDAASGSLTPGGVGVSLANGAGGVVLRATTTAGVTTSQYAFAAEGGISLEGVEGVTLTADDLLVTYNRWGDDLAFEVATATGTYAVDLADNETRLRGNMTVAVAGAFETSGDMFMESRENQQVLLADGTTVTVDQLVIAGADLSVLIGNETVGAQLDQTNIAIVVSTQEVTAGQTPRRWITTQAEVGQAVLRTGIELEIDAASLFINREMVGGAILNAEGTAIDWNGADDSQSTDLIVNDTTTLSLADGTQRFELGLTGGLVFGPARLAGTFGLQLSEDTNGQAWTILASDVSAGLSANGATVELENGSGQLVIASDGSRSGEVTGTARVTGVEGLTLEGTLAASFDAEGNMQLAGTVDLGIEGFAAVSGQFAVTKVANAQTPASIVIAKADESDLGAVTRVVMGGETTATMYLLTTSATTAGGTQQFREGSYTFKRGTQTIAVSTLATNGAAYSDEEMLARFDTAAETLFGANTVEVTGDRVAGFELSLVGTLAGRNLDGLTMVPPADPADKDNWGTTSLVSRAQNGSHAEFYLLLKPASIINVSGAKFTLDMGPDGTTAEIRYIADKNRQTVAIQKALDAILGANAAEVVFDKSTGGITTQGFKITFPNAGSPTSLSATAITIASNGSVMPGVVRVAVTATQVSAEVLAKGTVQDIDLYDANLAGTFVLEFRIFDQTFETADIVFSATADEVALAIREARNAGGTVYGDRGGDATATLVTKADGSHKWQVEFTGAALGRNVPVMTGTITGIERAPTASLVKVTAGSTTSEVQRLAVPENGDVFALAFGSQVTAPLASDVTALDVQAALEKLVTIGRGNVTVVDGTNVGTFDVTFGGTLAKSAIAKLKFGEVQTLDLNLPDGLADTVSLRAVGQNDWQGTLDLTQIGATDLRATLATALGTLQDDLDNLVYGSGNLSVHVTDVDGRFYVVGAGTLSGGDLTTVVAGLTRATPEAPEYLLIGAQEVNGTIGSAQAGATLADGALGLVISRALSATGDLTTGFAMKAVGAVALQGFGNAVSLSATGSIAINELGRAVAFNVPSGLDGATYAVGFEDGTQQRELIVDEGTLTVDGLGDLTGGLVMNIVYHKVNGLDTTDVRIGLVNVEGSLTAGGLSAGLSEGTGAVLLRNQQGIGSFYAVQAEGNVAFDAGGAVGITADKLQVTLNRWGEDLIESVATPGGLYDVDLIDNETRLRGVMSVDIGGVVQAEGQLFLELRDNQTVTLSDASAVTVDQILIGGADASASIGTGDGSASFEDFDMLMAVSTEVVASGDARRWVSGSAFLGEATIAGYTLGAIQDASLKLNQRIATVNGIAAVEDAPVIDWSVAALSVPVETGAISEVTLNFERQTLEIGATASLNLGDAYVQGTLTLARELGQAGVQDDLWRITATDGSMGMRLGDVGLNLSDISGDLLLNDDKTRSGSISGAAALTGIEGVTLEGDLTAAFDTQNNFRISGQADLDVLGVATLKGDFAIEQVQQNDRAMLMMGVTNLNAGFEVDGVGSAGLQNGEMFVLAGTGITGASGFAIKGSALAVIDTPVIDMQGVIAIEGNTLGFAIERTQGLIDLSGVSTDMAMNFAAGILPPKIEFGELDAQITDILYGAVDTVGLAISDLKADISPNFDKGGININTNPLAIQLPVIGVSISQITGADRLLSIGDYVQRYLGSRAAEFQNLASPVYDIGNVPTLTGMLSFLQDNWLPEIGVSRDALTLVTTSSGIKISFDDQFSLGTQATLNLDEAAEEYGLSIDGTVTAEVSVALDVNFDLDINWSTGTSKFELHRLAFDATASVKDIDVTAALGPLSVSVGDKDRETGTLSFALGGEIRQGTTGLSVVQTKDELVLDLPVYAQLGSLDLSASVTPRLIASGNPLSGDVTWAAQDFDSIGDFSSLSVVDLILMFPDFLDTLEQVQNSELFANSLPFLDSGLDQVLAFGEGFERDVYNKIDFDKPRIDLFKVASVKVGTVTATPQPGETYGESVTVLLNAVGGFTETLIDGRKITLYQTVTGIETEVGTFDIDGIRDANTIVLKGAAAASGTFRMVLHEARQQITTLQEFMLAVNKSGVLPAGLEIFFDPVERSFGVPFAFAEDLTPVDVPLNLDLGSDVVSLTTSAQGSLSVHVAGSVTFFADLDGRTYLGEKGSVEAGSNLFSDDTFVFDSTMVGYGLELDGEKYTVVGFRGDHIVALDRALADGVNDLGYTLRENSLTLGIEDVSLTAGASLNVDDLEVGLQIGMLKATAGGVGTGSGMSLEASIGVTLDRNPGSGNAQDVRFALSDISASDLNFDVTGTASAKLRGLSVDPGLGADIPLAPNIEVSLTALDLFSPGSLKVINQNPMYAADLNKLVADGKVASNDIVVILPDLGAAFDFKDISFLDIISGTRQGLEFIRDAIEDQPFYTVVMPVVGRSLEDVFPFVDQFLEKLEVAATNPAAAISEVEKIIEDALGVVDDNTLDINDQIFALSLNGDALDIHLNLGAVFEENFGFSLDLQQLAAIAGPDALAGFDFVDDIADVINPGAAGKINLSAFVNLRVQAGIRLDDGVPEFFLYDYNPTRVQNRAAASFGSVVFGTRSSVLSDANTAEILADFRRVIVGAGDGVIGVSALVNTHWITPIENSDTGQNIDEIHGNDQLAGRRQSEIVALQDWLSGELGVTVALFAGTQTEVAQGDETSTFTGVEIDRKVEVSAEKARGTAASLGLRVAGQDLELGFEAGPARLGVAGGWAAIDRDGLASTVDYATFAITLDQRAGSLEDDGRFYIGPERLSNNIGYEIVGAMGMDLPISLEVSSLPTIKLSSFTASTGPAGVQGLLDMAAGRLVQGKVIDIKVPNVQDVMDNFLGEFSLLGMLTDPSIILDGVDGALGVVQDMLGDELGRDIPVIGEKLAAAGNFVRDVRVGFLNDLREKLSAEGGTVPILQSSLWDLFGTGTDGLNLILDKDNNTIIDKNDISIEWVDRDGIVMSQWVKGALPPAAADAIQVDMDLGKNLIAANIDIPLDFEVPGFSLDIEGGFTFDLGWAWDFGFGISTSSGFYLKTNTDDTKEIRVQADAFLTGVGGKDGPAFQAVGSLLFFDAKVTDAQPGGIRSGASAVLGIDIAGDARGRLPITKLFSQSPTQTFDVGFDVTSAIDLLVELEVKEPNEMP